LSLRQRLGLLGYWRLFAGEMITKGIRNLLFEALHGFRGYPVSFGEFCFRLDASLRRWDSDCETIVRETLVSLIQQGFWVADIGANFGMHALVAAEQVGESGRVFAFEPMPKNANLLRRHADLNGFAACFVIEEAAVSNSVESMIEIMAPQDALAVTASLHWKVQGTVATQVRNLRLDDYAAFAERSPDLVKIDVEGAELDVLRGGERLLSRSHPILLLEVHPRQLASADSQPSEVESLLGDLGYQFAQLQKVEGDREYHLLCRPK
jgi:FkbM family methyltransferase